MFSSRVAALAISSALALAATSIGCGSAAEAPPATAASAGTKAPLAQNAHGVVKLLGEALADVPLRPEQRAQIEKLAQEAEARHEPVRRAHVDVTAALADQIEKNAVDGAALQPKVDAAAAALEAAQAGDRAALEKLHDILDASQRAALVDALRARFHGRHGEHAEHAEHADDAKRGKHGDGEHGDHARKHGPKAAMAEWSRDLALTEEQQDRIRTIFREQMKTAAAAHEHAFAKGDHGGHHDPAKVLDAFKEEKFSLDAVAPKRDPRGDARAMSERMVGMIKVVLPELTQEQRVRAAAKIRSHADLGPVGGF